MKRISATIAVLAAIAVRTASAAPSISGVQGTFGHRQNITILGSGFGSKSPAAPLVWADFDGGLNPGAGGLNRSWSYLQNVQWSSNEGASGGAAKAADGSGFWTLRVDYNSWSRDGQKMYLFKKEKLNFKVSGTGQNWKSWRMWPAGNGYPNIYSSQSHGRITVENIGGEGGYWAKIAVGHTNWSTQEFIFRASTFGHKDGKLTIRYDGNTVADGTVMTRSAAAPNYMQWNYVMHGVAANHNSWSPGWSSSNRIWNDDIYVDTTWARVMLGNASTFSSCSRLDIQIPSAWNAGSIAVMARAPGYSQGTTAYLYVFDSNGSVNPNGYPVRVGAAGTGGPEVPSGPAASAGPDAVAAIGTALPMHGSYSSGTAATSSARWSVVSGPGNVEFADPADPNTTAKFSSVGDYVLQFTLTAGTDHITDEVRITVIPTTVGAGGIKQKNFFSPSRGETFRIVHVMEQPGHLEAQIMDRTGHLVRSLDGGDRPTGEQVIEWDGKNGEGSTVASGIYLVIRKANGRHATSKVAVLN